MIAQLQDNYIPKKILFREEQIEEVKKIFESFKKDFRPKNRIISGGTGTAKTTLIKKICEDYSESDYIYLSCAGYTTSKRTFRSLLPSVKSFQKIIDYLNNNRKILIFDEINKISNITEFFDDLNTLYRGSLCPVVLITNRADLFRKMPDDAYQTLNFQKIMFNPYNAIEFTEIINERIKEIKESGNKKEIPEGSIEFLSALLCSDGSIRRAFEILEYCYEDNNFSNLFIRNQFSNIQVKEKKLWINSLYETEKEVFKTILDIAIRQIDNKEFNNEIAYNEVGKEFLKKSHIKTGERVSQIITKFEKDFVIHSEEVWFGRVGGKHKILKFFSGEDLSNYINLFYPDNPPYDIKFKQTNQNKL